MALTKDIELEFSLLGRSMVTILENIPLAKYTTLKIGGNARYFVEAKTTEEIVEACKFAKDKKMGIFVLGDGSHVLFSDKGFDGLVIKTKNLKFKIKNSSIEADVGVGLAEVVKKSANVGLSGLEWAIGIPGTMGGAICNNSGAYGRSISDIFESAEVLVLKDMSVKTFLKDDCDFCYRESIFKKNNNLIILNAVFKLGKGDKEKIRQTMKNYTKDRAKSGRATDKSAGCFFKNIEWSRLRQGFGGQVRDIIDKEKFIKKFPELKQFENKPKIPAGFLIEFLGFKNKKVGGAVVSDKHAAFIVNSGSAKASDVIKLRGQIKEHVRKRYGFDLEDEVTLAGFF